VRTSRVRPFAQLVATSALLGLGVAVAVVSPSPSRTADAQEVVLDVAPPAAFLATVEPFYYDNRPVYWYANRWRYRDAQGWHSYDAEPRLLQEHRAHMPQTRWSYASHGNAGRGGGDRGGGGARGGARGGHGGRR
jgi:hypothetical protein